jgi:hypothetical protein
MSIEATTTALSLVEPSVGIDVIADAIGKVDALKRAAKEATAELDGLLTEYVQVNGPVTIGTIRYYVGPKRKTKLQLTLERALTILIESAQGDVGTVAGCLSSDALKHGACRDVLGDRWDEVFVVVEETELKEGKPVKAAPSLQKLDTRFLV